MPKDNYEDIIDLPHPVSKKHPQMSIHDRAAQFAPFAALTGHEEGIDETAKTHLADLIASETNEIFTDEC